MDSPPRLLYKYLSPERATILAHRRIRFTPLGAFNDPFEGRPSVTTLAPDSELRRLIKDLLPSEAKRAYDWLPPHMREAVPFDMFESAAAQLATAKEPEMLQIVAGITKDVTQLIHTKVDEFFGVLSLSEVRDSLLMWSHYAASHTGLVLGFDPRHSYFNRRKTENDELRHLRRVQYRDSRPSGALTGMDGIDLFFVKSVHWSYEREWRMLVPLEDAAEVISSVPYAIHLFDFPAAAVKEVIVGARMTDANRDAVLSSVRACGSIADIQVKQAVPDATDFKLRLDELPV